MPTKLAIADRGYVLETGKVVLSGTGKELLASEEVKKHIWVAKRSGDLLG